MKHKENRPEWFNDILRRALKKVDDNVSLLAEKIGVPGSTLNEVVNGKTQHPKITLVEPILNFLNEPLPGEVREVPTLKAQAVPIVGHVSAGLMSWPGDGPESGYGTGEFIHINLSDWNSTRQDCTKSGSAFILKVEGDSMDPDYKHGDYLVCKRWENKKPEDIKSGTPCIFEEDGQYTFKLLRRTNEGEILGEPINRSFDFVSFKGNYDIPFVVVGKITGLK